MSELSRPPNGDVRPGRVEELGPDNKPLARRACGPWVWPAGTPGQSSEPHSRSPCSFTLVRSRIDVLQETTAIHPASTGRAARAPGGDQLCRLPTDSAG